LHVLIRTDLGMTKGKICAQAAHAVLGLCKDLLEQDPVAFGLWASVGFPQETYEAHSMEDLYSTEILAKSFNVMGYVVHDAGRT
jgi:PTH2 family peptidyl-tRNA hydrolase